MVLPAARPMYGIRPRYGYGLGPLRRVNKILPRRWLWVVGLLVTLCLFALIMARASLSTATRGYMWSAGQSSHEKLYNNSQRILQDIQHVTRRHKAAVSMAAGERGTYGIYENNSKLVSRTSEMSFTNNSRNLSHLPLYPPLLFNDSGLGQNGIGVKLVPARGTPEKERYVKGYVRNDFNEYLSDRISVDRTPPDLRHELCLDQEYPEDLPDTSVVITFLNEAWSVLIRTVHSIINMSPPHLLREIILVDDFSNYDHLKKPLDIYMKTLPKVKIIRNRQPEGLIRSRIAGAKYATGKVLTFLDSHIECVQGWLQPLLARIKENSSHVVWPGIPAIDRDTFGFPKKMFPNQVGGFKWAMTFTWEYADLKKKTSRIAPIMSPTMPGGLFSIDKDYFFHLGSYDEQMRFWGGENLEISFRIWMCGGTLELIPCSLVGHIFRQDNPNSGRGNTGDYLRNTRRTAAVWLDQYKELYSFYSGKKLKDYGDISSRVELRKELKCRSFKWYLTNVYTSVFLPEKAVVYGQISSVLSPSNCLQVDEDEQGRQVNMKYCRRGRIRLQVFFYMGNNELRLAGHCVDAAGEHPLLYGCHKMKGNQLFLFRKDKTIYVPVHRTCLHWMGRGRQLYFKVCDGSRNQQWSWTTQTGLFTYSV